MVNKAADADCCIYSNSADHGWMYLHSFADPHGHQVGGVLYMDESKLPAL